MTYLKLSNIKLGILVNFNVDQSQRGFLEKSIIYNSR
ncbi:GxxExxY protein [Algoriphagus halophilus]